MVRDRRLPDNPLAHLEGTNEALDRRHDRRPPTLEELRRLLAAARASKRAFRGLAGPDRALLYATAAASGFRAEELSHLCPEDFDLAAEVPAVALARRDTKNRQGALQPLPADLVAALGPYLSDKPAGLPVWPGNWFRVAAPMLRIDLEAAGIPYVSDGPEGPLFVDFHALRHAYVALLDQAGASLKVAMQLARHSDPKLTMARYGRAQLHDLAAAVNRLPGLLVPEPPAPEIIAAAATGTEGGSVRPFASADGGGSLVAPLVALPAGPEGPQQAPSSPLKKSVLAGIQ
jgi:integrase